MKTHPSQRFAAPLSIQRGVPLKTLVDRRLVALVSESIVDAWPAFDESRFVRQASQGLDTLELSQRAIHVAQALAKHLPTDFDEAATVLIQSLGPPLAATEGNGLAPFFYLPHAQFIATQGVTHFESGMRANYELTKRFTAEFSIRPFLVAHRTRCLARLKHWACDPDPHVRRLVSEGTRPRLPWAGRLPEFQQDPKLALPLLELLKDDPELYVRRSVANHLGDMAKDHLDSTIDVCERWLDEVDGVDAEPDRAARRRWVVHHALRHPAKQKHGRAVRVRTRAARGKRRGA